MFSFVYSIKRETVHNILHQGGNLIIAQITDTPFVRMADFLNRGKLSGFDVQADLLVGIPERHAFEYEAVDFFHTEKKCVFVVVQDMLVHFHLPHHVRNHTEAVLQFVEGGKE